MGPQSSVLDVGCGTGRFTTRIARSSGAHMYALDNSATMLRKALNRDKRHNVNWVLGDAHSLPYKRDSFDSIYMTMVLHHVESMETVLAELMRVLCRRGRCVILTTSHSAIRRHPLRYFPGIVALDLKRFPSIPALKSLMSRAGFKNARSFVISRDEGEIPVETYCRMVKKKYISTLSLLDENKFESGFRVFRNRIKKVHGKRMRRVLTFNLVVGEKL